MEEIKNNWRIKDLVGKKFGKLEVISYDCKKSGHVQWNCLCECGNTCKALSYRLNNGNTKSCGCLNKTNDTNFTGYEEIAGTYYCQLKHSAKKRNLELEVSNQEIWELFIKQNRKCALSGVDIFFVRNYRSDHQEQTASLDRIDSTKGYTIDNIQWVHKHINTMKMSLSQQKFLEWCEIITKFNKEKSNESVISLVS